MIITYLIVALAITLLVSCVAQKPAPVAIDEKVDVCAVCNMFVKNNGYAAELITPSGRSYKFDDVGELFIYQNQHPELPIAALYVQDATTREWLEPEAAFCGLNRVRRGGERDSASFGFCDFRWTGGAECG